MSSYVVDLKIKSEVMKFLEETECIQFGEFTLASGAKSDFYIDLRLMLSFPKICKKICDIGSKIIEDVGIIDEIDAVVGIPLAAIPFSTLISLIIDKPQYLLRKDVKDHGTKKILEGKWQKGQKILLVDDLITSGTSKLQPIEKLRNHGLIVDHLFVFIYRSEIAKDEMEKQLGVKITSILELADLKNAKLLK